MGYELLSNAVISSLAFREVFDLFDSNGGGTIDAEELDLALRSVEIHLSQEDLQEVLSAMDKDGNEKQTNKQTNKQTVTIKMRLWSPHQF